MEDKLTMMILLETNKMLRRMVNDLDNRVKALEKQSAPKKSDNEEKDWEAEKERVVIEKLSKAFESVPETVTDPDGRKIYVFGAKGDGDLCECAICTARRAFTAKRKAEEEPREEHNNNEEK
jgi:hypothetical protein